ncbi:hypothetical protein V8F20_005964 [Naviculisporaceae sp. PSN 640]
MRKTNRIEQSYLYMAPWKEPPIQLCDFAQSGHSSNAAFGGVETIASSKPDKLNTRQVALFDRHFMGEEAAIITESQSRRRRHFSSKDSRLAVLDLPSMLFQNLRCTKAKPPCQTVSFPMAAKSNSEAPSAKRRRALAGQEVDLQQIPAEKPSYPSSFAAHPRRRWLPSRGQDIFKHARRMKCLNLISLAANPSPFLGVLGVPLCV